MKMRHKRRMRTRPRLYTLGASVPCAPYMMKLGDFEMQMTTRRVYVRFFAQDADHSLCIRKIRAAADAHYAR